MFNHQVVPLLDVTLVDTLEWQLRQQCPLWLPRVWPAYDGCGAVIGRQSSVRTVSPLPYRIEGTWWPNAHAIQRSDRERGTGTCLRLSAAADGNMCLKCRLMMHQFRAFLIQDEYQLWPRFLMIVRNARALARPARRAGVGQRRPLPTNCLWCLPLCEEPEASKVRNLLQLQCLKAANPLLMQNLTSYILCHLRCTPAFFHCEHPTNIGGSSEDKGCSG